LGPRAVLNGVRKIPPPPEFDPLTVQPVTSQDVAASTKQPKYLLLSRFRKFKYLKGD
jgi:hypothetical protein